MNALQKKLFLALLAIGLTTNQAMAVLTIDTSAIATDIGTAGTSGTTIALLVGGALIAFGLVKKFIK